jgi:AraC-like DNA-binding protein
MQEGAGMSDAKIRVTPLIPTAALRHYVRRFLVVESLADRTNTLLPDTAIVAGFRFQGECSHDGSAALRCVVTGLRDRPRRLSHPRGSATILAMFTATGAAALVREPLENLFNATMPMECQVRRSALDAVEEQLAEATTHTLRARVLERFLLDQLHSRPADARVANAVARIREARGQLRIGELAREAGWSQSALERRFHREVGASPKKFANIVRMRHAVRLHAAGASLTETAYAAGYADQPHFIRDFKRFSGLPPESFFRSQMAYC